MVIQTATYCLTLPGKELFLSPFLSNKKFREKGNKEGAIKAFDLLQQEGLGQVMETTSVRGTSKVDLLYI